MKKELLVHHYIYYINSKGEHCPGIINVDKGVFCKRRYKITINTPDSKYSKSFCTSANKLELQECERNDELTEGNDISNHLEHVFESKAKCYFCGEEKTIIYDSIFIKGSFFQAKGWRVIDSDRYGIIALACPECVKKYNNNLDY